MTKKRFKLIYNEYQTSNGKTIKAEPYFIDTKEEYVDEVYFTIKGYPTMSDEQVVDLLNEQEERIEKLQRYNKSQELEIVRLHKLADAMSGVLKELGVYDVYDEEQINSVKEKLK